MLKRIVVAAVMLVLLPTLAFGANKPPDRSYHGTPMQGTWTITWTGPDTASWYVFSYQARGDIVGLYNSTGTLFVSKVDQTVVFREAGTNDEARGTINAANNNMMIRINRRIGIWGPHTEYLR